MAADRHLRIPRLVWMMLVGELRRRGAGRRESGAFLLGRAEGGNGRIKTFACYDDLDPDALATGAVNFHARGYSALWALCRERGLKVIADAHTHPSKDVRQSWIDQANPMLPVQGHVALILPRYGHASRWSLTGVGMYTFLGGDAWRSIAPGDPDVSVALCAW